MVFKFKVDPRKVLFFIKQKGEPVTQKEIMEKFYLNNLQVQEILAYLMAKWRVYPKGYSVWGGNKRVPMVKWVYRDGRPQRSKTVKSYERKSEHRKKLSSSNSGKVKMKTADNTEVWVETDTKKMKRLDKN